MLSSLGNPEPDDRLDKFAAFLNALERSRPVIFIDKFQIIRSRDSNSNHTVDMKLAVLVGKNGKPEEIGKADSIQQEFTNAETLTSKTRI